MENNQTSAQSKCLFILVIVTIFSCYYFLYQVNITRTSFQPYKSMIFKFIFYENNSKTSNESNYKTINNFQSTIFTNKYIKKVLKSSFAKIHEKVILNRTEQNVVFYKISGAGYGNRIYSMLSAFLAAIISDSALLIDWPSIDNYIESPLVNVFKKFTDNSFLDFNQKSPKICTINTMTPNTWSFNKQLGFLQGFYKNKDLRIPDNCSRFYVSDITPYFFDLAANLKHAEKLVLHEFIKSQSLEKVRNALIDSNLNQNTKLDILFQIGFEFAGHVLNNYWLLKPSIQEKVNNFIRQKFTGNFIIGLQMRFEYLNQDDVESFISCALKIENSNNLNIGNRTIKWFIATDQNAQIQNILRQYSDKILIGEGKVGHVAFESDVYERAILDIELLSHCNETILTGGSTFGFIGSLKSQKRPYFVEGKRSMKECKLLDFYSPARTPSGYSIFR